MAIIINIETATQMCSVALAKDGDILTIRELNEKNVHAEVLTNFVQELLQEATLELKDLDAVAVSSGPGSYTGLRIGVSTAKGLCYSLDIPIISVDSLQAMAQFAAIKLEDKLSKNSLLVPMIDARRMEVYTALYNQDIEAKTKIAPHIFTEDSFVEETKEHTLILTGDGCSKSKELFAERENIEIHDEILSSSIGMVPLSEKKYNNKEFEDLAYFEPFYLKEFIAGIPRVKGLR